MGGWIRFSADRRLGALPFVPTEQDIRKPVPRWSHPPTASGDAHRDGRTEGLINVGLLVLMYCVVEGLSFYFHIEVFNISEIYFL